MRHDLHPKAHHTHANPDKSMDKKRKFCELFDLPLTEELWHGKCCVRATKYS